MQAALETHPLIADYESFDSSSSLPEELAALRRRGLESFEKVGFPTTRLEEWRFTNIAPVGRESWVRSEADASQLNRDKIEPFLLPDCIDLVFVNGQFSTQLSSTEKLPQGTIVASLAQAMAENTALVTPHLGKYADLEHPFVALNTAHIEDGAFIHVPSGARLEKTVHLLFVSITEDQAIVSYPRNLIVAEESAELTMVESYIGFSGQRYFTCPVTEIYGGANSVVDHYRLGEEGLDAYHLATSKIHLERDAQFFTHSVNHGGAIVRNDIQAYLGGEGIHCTLNGLYLGRGKQVVDHHMWVDHAMPNCHSYELFKGILEDSSRAVFNGRIKVHQDAQKTDAKQSSQHLLLSDNALAHSNPQLEIFADDVRCTHGSTTGHLDEEAVFYLRSRGISPQAAKSLLTYAFAGEVLEEIRLETVKKNLEEFLFTRLPKGDVVRQAV